MRSRADEIGGTISIESAPGKGTVVRVVVPVGEDPNLTDAAIRVLIVDDHAVVRRGLLAFLETEPDLEVVGAAAGGAEALAQLDQLASAGGLPDVVLMDLRMEPLDGIETTRRIRARHADVEVVALTSFGETARVHAALEAGASGYLLKDADADEVAAADAGRPPWRAAARPGRRPPPHVLAAALGGGPGRGADRA